MAIVVDTSALAAIVFGEPDAAMFVTALAAHAGDVSISAATLVEARIVVEGRQGRDALDDLERALMKAAVKVEPVDEGQAALASTAWQRFGKGRHAADLNFGDCFSYALSKSLGAPLLFKGQGFSQTDVASVL